MKSTHLIPAAPTRPARAAARAAAAAAVFVLGVGANPGTASAKEIKPVDEWAEKVSPKLKVAFASDVGPLLGRFCYDCHDGEDHEGETDLGAITNFKEALTQPALWENVDRQLQEREMPPDDKPQPTEEERERILNWIGRLITEIDRHGAGLPPPRTVLRRLNHNEYNNTLRDLFGVRSRPGDDFPPDGGGEAGFDNDADALFVSPLLLERYMEAANYIVEHIYRSRQLRNHYLRVRPGPRLTPRNAALQVIQTFATRAYRRPVEQKEVLRLLNLFNPRYAESRDFEEAMKAPLLAILISPRFLYKVERRNPDEGPRRVDDYELAVRLSYFLWSSMPDSQLFRLAAKGELSKPKVFEAEVARMLKHEKARTLATSFGGQWFGWDELRDRVNPDTKRFPEFTNELRASMYHESVAFFDHLVKTDGSLLDLIHCDYAFVNETLARHYGIAGVEGAELRKVSLTDPNRGGVLGMGSVLTKTSMPLRTSPVLRGVWVLEEILGTPPPPPPGDAGELPQDDRALGNKTFREVLEIHREEKRCASCHKKIDPIGFGLENFDAIGRWRTQQGGKPVDARGLFPGGESFESPLELKQKLLDKKDLFVKLAARKALAYALGRSLKPVDRPTINTIVENVAADGYKLNTLILEVARSRPFNFRVD